MCGKLGIVAGICRSYGHNDPRRIRKNNSRGEDPDLYGLFWGRGAHPMTTDLQQRQAACLKAAGYAKPTKKELLTVIDEILESSESFDPKLVGLVWLYFEKNPSQKAANYPSWWVAQAVSKDETRPSLHNVRCEPGKLIATDGHRLHIATNQNVVSKGFLEPTTLTPIEFDEQFPPYDQILNSAPPATKIVSFDDFEPVAKDVVKLGEVFFERRYIKEAFAGSETMRVSKSGPRDVARFEGENRTALIMPRRY
jgi:hypothetical protein